MRYFFSDCFRMLKSWKLPVAFIGVAISFFVSLEYRGVQIGLLNHALSVHGFFSMACIGSERMITLIFCMFPMALVFCEDMECQYIRYAVIRGSLPVYVWSKMVLIYLSSILAMVVGGLLFIFICSFGNPWATAQELENGFSAIDSVFGSLLSNGRYLAYYTCNFFRYGLFAAILSAIAAYCSLFIRNKLLTLILPLCFYEIMREGIMVKWISIYMFFPQTSFFYDSPIVGFFYPLFLSILITLALGFLVIRKLKKVL